MTTKRKAAVAKTTPTPKPANPPSPAPAAMSMLTAANVSFFLIDKHHVSVADTFLFWPATGYWRDKARTIEGNGARKLIAEIAIRQENAGGLDAVEKALANA